MKLGTRLRSAGMRVMSSESLLELRRRKSRLFDKKRIETPAVHYFHQVDDPYSFLAVQKLAALQARYNIQFHSSSGQCAVLLNSRVTQPDTTLARYPMPVASERFLAFCLPLLAPFRINGRLTMPTRN